MTEVATRKAPLTGAAAPVAESEAAPKLAPFALMVGVVIRPRATFKALRGGEIRLLVAGFGSDRGSFDPIHSRHCQCPGTRPPDFCIPGGRGELWRRRRECRTTPTLNFYPASRPSVSVGGRGDSAGFRCPCAGVFCRRADLGRPSLRSSRSSAWRPGRRFLMRSGISYRPLPCL